MGTFDAPPTRTTWALMLMQRGAPSDVERSHQWLTAARATANVQGYTHVEQQCTAALAERS
jgi:hypothetical protein